MSEELWHQMGNKTSIHTSSWPAHDEKYLTSDTLIIVVQINGKVRANIEMPTKSTEEEVIKVAQANKKIQTFLKNKKVRRSIYVPGKLINLVV